MGLTSHGSDLTSHGSDRVQGVPHRVLSVASIKLYVSFAEYPLFYRALLQKRPKKIPFPRIVFVTCGNESAMNCLFTAHVVVWMSLTECRALLRKYRALLRKYRALLRKCRALLSIICVRCVNESDRI